MEVLPEGGVSPCVIKVIGVGGGGGNAVSRMTEQPIPGVEFWCLNTDAQAINRHPETIKTLTIGNDVTRGLGAGGVPEIGKRAAEESKDDVAEVVAGADMVFVTAGMGGGTGSGAAPVVAEVAKEMGSLTVGVVTKPFGFEGRRRMTQADGAINELRNSVDTLIIVANDKLLEIIPPNTPLERAFSVADDILRQGVVGISEIIVRPGLINVDFADVRSVMQNAGTALMGIGRGEGKTRAEDAAAAAISSPLLEAPIDKAKGIVFNIVGGKDMTLQEINAAAEVIYENVDPSANIIFGALVDDRMQGEMSITVLATGFQTKDELDRMQGGGRQKAPQQVPTKQRAAQAGGYQQQRMAPPPPARAPPMQGGGSPYYTPGPPPPQQQPPMQNQPPPQQGQAPGEALPDFLTSE
ncbi:unnamed protein product [Chrysoparadoxa australica]